LNDELTYMAKEHKTLGTVSNFEKGKNIVDTHYYSHAKNEERVMVESQWTIWV